MPIIKEQVRTEVILLRFATSSEGTRASDLAGVLDALMELEQLLWFPNLLPDRHLGMSRINSHLRVLYISQRSPLSAVLWLKGVPSGMRQVFIRFLKNLVFFDEHKSLKGAEAALAWETVRAKQLENVKTIVDLLQTTQSTPIKHDLIAQRLQSLMPAFRTESLTLSAVETVSDETERAIDELNGDDEDALPPLS